MLKMNIFKNHPQGSAGARAVLLAKSICPTENPTFFLPMHEKMYAKWKLDTICEIYDQKIEKKTIEQERVKLRDRKIEPYCINSVAHDEAWMYDCFFQIALTLHYAIDGKERDAWSALADASWLAGYGAQLRKTGLHIQHYSALAISSAISRKASNAARDGHQNSTKNNIKNSIKDHWQEWQFLIDTDPLRAKALYKNKTAFAYDMLNKHSKLKGSSKNDTSVIMGWIREWEKPKKAVQPISFPQSVQDFEKMGAKFGKMTKDDLSLCSDILNLYSD